MCGGMFRMDFFVLGKPSAYGSARLGHFPSAELSQLDRSSPAAKDFYNVLLQNKNSPACFF